MSFEDVALTLFAVVWTYALFKTWDYVKQIFWIAVTISIVPVAYYYASPIRVKFEEMRTLYWPYK